MENGYTFQWKIKSISYCWLQKGEPIESPTFDVYPSLTTKWSLVLYPRGIVTENRAGVCLRRENDFFGPSIIEASFQFAFLDANGSILKVKFGTTRGFARGSVSGAGEFISQDTIFGTGRKTILPQDILIVQCTVWIKDEIPMIKYNESFWSSFQLNSRSFLWKIDGFNTLRPGQRNQFVVMNESNKVLVSFHLVSDFKREINLEIISCDKSLKCFSFKIAVIDSEGQKINFGDHKFFADFEKINKPLISREQLMKNESRYLPKGVLSLACEFVYSTGSILHGCEENNFGVISPIEIREFIEKEDEPVVSRTENQQMQPLANDLKSMYDEAILCDSELRTSTQTFSVHKTILSARSPVFRRMFSNDMKEKNSGHVDITGLENDTVQRMLLYIYTDRLEDLQFESASRLYSAAVKYEILSLKEKCRFFFKDNLIQLSPREVCDLQTFARRHQDEDLEFAVGKCTWSLDKKVLSRLEDLRFESASKLYSTADKYANLSLKEKCSSFLKDSLNPTNACDLLLLADRHQDDDLKCAVQDYILSHDKEIFGLLEWKYFMANNLQLAADIMHRKLWPNQG
ncbi:unnamed protein product [Larinioides sclopetarius]|uniref:Speckle-type POZ protein n=1 Tax=Larinioides sclopetarius TaxID=280406 RepID=A0AAV2AEW9_9ARAC